MQETNGGEWDCLRRSEMVKMTFAIDVVRTPSHADWTRSNILLANFADAKPSSFPVLVPAMTSVLS